MAEGGDMFKEIPDFEPTDLGDDDDDGENMEMDPISPTTRLINPDDNDDDGDGTFYKSPNTSTSIDQGYLGYSEYMAERKRLQWEIKAEEKKPVDIRERDEEYDRRREAGQELKRYIPAYNPNDSTFNVTYGKDGSILAEFSNRKGSVPHIVLTKDKVLMLEDLPKTMRKALGADYESMLKKYNDTISQLNEEKEKNIELKKIADGLMVEINVHPQEISRYEEKEKELRQFIERQKVEKSENKSLFDETAKQNIELKIQIEKLLNETKLYKEEIDKYKKDKSNLSKLEQSRDRLQDRVNKFEELSRKSIIYTQEQIADMESKKEEILKNLPLRERIKYIFKKYGFTVFAVVSAVGVVIGAIVSNLSNGLTRLGKGVGNGFKAIGKKLGEILPGMVGAIVSFLFKTAGEVIGFLGKNAWLLIMAVVLYFVESVKKRK